MEFSRSKDGNSAQIHAYLLWNHLWQNNCDYAIDLHSQSTDTEYPLFVFADYRVAAIKAIAELSPADQIKNDEGEKEQSKLLLLSMGFQQSPLKLVRHAATKLNILIEHSKVSKNILNHLQIWDCPLGRNAASYGSFIGNQMHSVKSNHWWLC